ncbi:MAG: insulinase family protein [Actinomycetota bacterium]|nr:insulinase family protein [Actinomycetota bacterium]
MHYRLTTLPNGLRIITEDMPSVRSVAIGCWVDTGSRDEIGPEAGTSHFLEHLLFKGSQAWPAQRISEALDAVGARNNAFTSKEYTAYWARLRSADLPLAVEILADMLERPAFRQNEIDSERHVVLEEINMNEDDPTDVAHELFVEALWEGHPLSPPILGTRHSILDMTRDTIAGYWGRRYTPPSTVVAVAGRIDHDEVVDLVGAFFGDWQGEEVTRQEMDPVTERRINIRRRDTEQAHLVFGATGLSRGDERRHAMLVADHILGGGMSSRLFREIREQRGLAYAVHSFRLPFLETGAVAIYVGTTPNQAPEVLKLIHAELDKVMEFGLTADELERAKGHVQGSLALSMEDSDSLMTRLGRSELTGVEHLSIDEIVARIEAVTEDDILDVVRHAYSGPYVLGAVGPFDAEDLEAFVA